MTATLFVIPIKNGRKSDYIAFVNEILGPKQKDYKELHKRYDLNSTEIWIHSLNDRDYAMFVHDVGEDAEKRLQGWSSSIHPFDQWFNQQLIDCYDIDSLDEMPPQPEFFGKMDLYE